MKSLLLFFICIVSGSAVADSLNKEVEVTSQLRQEVELLSLEIENLKKSQQSEMDVYIQRDQEVSAQILKEKFRTEQLVTQIKLGQNKLESHSKAVKSKSSDEWLKNFWAMYSKSLSSGHPLFAPKLEERIQKLKLDLDQKKISYEHALLQTWFVLESDLSKSQEAEFILAPLQIEDKLLHVEMVRFGRTKGYFRTAEGKYGQLFHDQKWDVKYFEDSSSKEMIETLLAQFKQQQKTGLYRLPGINL